MVIHKYIVKMIIVYEVIIRIVYILKYISNVVKGYLVTHRIDFKEKIKEMIFV